ncbi:MAG: 4Fe-4S binding protein [Methylobacterium sp.]|nr:4Fe-4S binding protein [Methylobacterium sp.]
MQRLTRIWYRCGTCSTACPVVAIT